MLPEVLCDEKTRDKLGEDGLAAVTGRLWAGDCQTCGRPLGSEPPALCVDDAGEWATAALHHPSCRPPAWNDGSTVFATGGAHLSWTTLSFMLPTTSGRKPEPRPAMLLNPGLEMIFLEPRQGTWRQGYHRQFTSLGMLPPGRKLRFDRPLHGVSAWVANDLISVTVHFPLEAIYEANAATDVVTSVRKLRGLLLMVTHALDPAHLYATPDQAWANLRQLLQSGQVICGWVAAAQA